MKKHFFSTLVCSIFFINSFSQAAKSIYVELGGAGLASVNFDMRFSKKEDGLGFRAGIGFFSLTATSTIDNSRLKLSIITIPLGLTYLLGKDKKNYFELGAGITPVFGSDKNSYGDGTTSKNKFNGTFGHLYFGYRLQPANGGFLFRAGIMPVFHNGYFTPYYAGISFGHKF